MKLDEIVAWYQKKIGTYDKQQWEKTVEQKILDGFSGFTLKNAKLKTEFIDVDLVRGSTFPKAKPKQSLLTVIRLAILRYLLLPVYAKWWVQQTSPKAFCVLLFLYIMQMINWAVYTFNIHRLDGEAEHMVSLSELLIPMALGLILSLIHSQIVATNSGNSIPAKRKRYCNTLGKSRERTKRRKKLIKIRSNEGELAAHTSGNKLSRSKCSTPQDSTTNVLNKNDFILNESPSYLRLRNNCSDSSNIPKEYGTENQRTVKPLSDLSASSTSGHLPDPETPNNSLLNVKKRNVNWDSPIHNIAIENMLENLPPETDLKVESLTEAMHEQSIKNKTTIEKQTKEEAHNIAIVENLNADPDLKKMVGDDDGFESLNGKSSSGEENVASEILLQNIRTKTKDQMRLKLVENVIGEDNPICEEVFNASTPLPGYRRKYPLSSESDVERSTNIGIVKSSSSDIFQKKPTKMSSESSDTNEESEGEGPISSPSTTNCNYTECTTSATEWLGVTTNSEECSYSSELENSDYQQNQFSGDEGYDVDFIPTTILTSHGNNDRVSCTLWDHRDIKKAQMSVLDISSCIIERVEAMPETCDYIYIGVFFSVILSLIPSFCRLLEATIDLDKSVDINYFDVPLLLWEKASFSSVAVFRFAFGTSGWERTVLIIGFIQRLFLTLLLFILFAVAERTFKQRFLYAKLFSHLTSSRRARKSELPHFRLNKVRNIKTWLSVRSYLKKRGPQRSVDVIVSSAFLLTLLLLAFLSVEWLKDSVHLHSYLNLEALLWASALGIFLLRFMTLGNKINRKYRSISVLITEQINLYLQIEQKPNKKDELMVSNSVLKLAADLLKELESPFKISGLSANPYLYTTIKVVILSALSGVLSEMLGFKLKLHKIKIK